MCEHVATAEAQRIVICRIIVQGTRRRLASRMPDPRASLFVSLVLMATMATSLSVEATINSSSVESRSQRALDTIRLDSPNKPTEPTVITEQATTGNLLEEKRWECPNITGNGIECSCDFPHTLRCIGDRSALETISVHLRHSRPGMISLLDITVSGISLLPANFLEDVALHGLVVSTGELRRLHDNAFVSLARPLQALGLPNNLLESVPTTAILKLTGLERLDLSHNKIKTLEATSFQGFRNLTYLDLSDNLLSQLSPKAFSSLGNLRSLKMRANRLSVSALSALRGLKHLEELDLSANLLSGPLGSNLLPAMPQLRYLSVSENELKSVQQGALMEVPNLSSLSLSHNQIDVLEDDAFKYLSNLTHLDLAYNGIVAVSSASLAHLERLKSLDLTHNFLRSVNSDLIMPLFSLEELRLDDNDISMVSNELTSSKLKLKSLSLADNPLNCDCTLLEFANWLANSTLEEEDKLSAVCTTPPALENAILAQVSPGNLLCGDPTPPLMTRLPLAGAQLSLHEFHFDVATGVDLLWHVEPCTERYTCDTLIVYEMIEEKEVQIASSPIHCDSRLMRDPCSLPLSLPSSLRLEPGHKYRYCVVLMVPSHYDELSLGLGCSDIIQLEESLHLAPQDAETILPMQARIQPEISTMHVNLSAEGFLKVQLAMSAMSAVSAMSEQPSCQIELDVMAAESGQVHRQRLNCTSGATTSTSLSGLAPGKYRVCASLEVDDERRPSETKARCVEVHSLRQNSELLLLLLAVLLCLLILLVLFLLGRNLLKRTKKPVEQPQCFMPAQEVEITHKAHYIKLLATTKL